MKRGKLLFLKCGQAPTDLAAACGDYEHWFSQAMAAEGVDWDLAMPHQGAWDCPDVAIYAGVLVSGSPRSITQIEPWMAEVAELVRAAAQAGRPVLGVCFGHQLLGWAHGARVHKNPSGWELGTVSVDLTAEGRRDPLFAGLGGEHGTLQVNATHEDAVDGAGLPATVRVLASNAATPVQALAVGDHVRGVQFHPEVGATVSREYCLRRAPVVGQERAEALARKATETPEARQVLRNFIHGFVRRA